MTTPTFRKESGRAADLAAASRQSPGPDESEDAEIEQSAYADLRGADDVHTSDGGRSAGAYDGPGSLRTEPLFAADQAEGHRNRWMAIQGSFVDDPSAAVRAGDELVAQVMSELANSFAEQRHRFESQLDASGPGNTENLRVVLRSYRSFFERLLSL